MGKHMKATLEFDLKDEDAKIAFERCVKTENMVTSLWDIQQHLRTLDKYGKDGYDIDTIGKIRQDIINIIIDNGIDLDDL